MAEIIPAILPKNYEDLKNKISLVKDLVPIVQVDICDGVFVPTHTWPFGVSSMDLHFSKILNEEEGMPFWEDIDFELDLMVADAIENFDLYTKLSPKKIIFHIEAVKNKNDFKYFLEGIDIYIRDSLDIGIALNPSTPSEDIFFILSYVDFVQFMGSDNIGHQGESLDERVYDKIKVFRKNYPDIPIGVDIGVNERTASLLIKSGATKLYIGSAIFNTNDIIESIENFRNL